MSRKPKPLYQSIEGQLKLIALLMFIADQKQKSLHTMKQLLNRLMLPGKE